MSKSHATTSVKSASAARSTSTKSSVTCSDKSVAGTEGEESHVIHDGYKDVPESTTSSSLGTYATQLYEMHLSWRYLQSPTNTHSNRVLMVVKTSRFRNFINIVILLSAIQMGMAADLPDGDWVIVWQVSSIALTAIFALEMCMKLMALGCTYFLDGWNVLDFFVAWSSIIDCWILPIMYGSDEDRAQILKLFRLLRLLRIVKMLRVVPELMFVVEGMVASLRSMFWVFFLLAIILYTVGIYCVEAIGSENAGYSGWDDKAMDETVVDTFNNFMYFGTVTRSMVSLLGVVILSEWSPVVRPVWEKQPAIVFVFIGLIFLTTFGVLNVIIGVVVERTTDAMNQLRLKDVDKKKKEQTKAFKLITRLMFDLDTDCDKKVSKQEMEEGAENEQLHDLLQKVDFPHGFTYGDFHAMLDQDGSGFLSRSEFINGMFRLVYNDDFQRDCMFQLTMGQIKANQYKLHREIKDHVQQLYSAIKNELNTLRSDLNLRGSRKYTAADAFRVAELGEDEVFEDAGKLPSKSTRLSSQSSGLDLKSLWSQADPDRNNSFLLQPPLGSQSFFTVSASRSQARSKSEGRERSVQFEGRPLEDTASWEPLKSELVVIGEDHHATTKQAERADGDNQNAKQFSPSEQAVTRSAAGSLGGHLEPGHGRTWSTSVDWKGDDCTTQTSI